MAKIELPDLELEVLNLCLYPESFQVICEECNLSSDPNVIADAIKNLLHYKLLSPINEDNGMTNWMYDSDRMRDSQFRATAAGQDYLVRN